MKKVHLNSYRKVVLPADTIEEDGDSLLIKSGQKSFKVQLDRILYIEEDGLKVERPDVRSVMAPVLPVGFQSADSRPPVLGSAFSEAVQRNLSKPPAVVEPDREKVAVILQGALTGRYSVTVSANTANAPDTNEELVGEIFSSPDISPLLRTVRVVGFKKEPGQVTLDTKDREPVQTVNIPASLTSIISQVGALAAPSVRLPDIRKGPDEDTKE